MMRLHDYPLSGNCHKVRMLLHWLGLPCTTVPVDFHPGREHRSTRFLAEINPRGQLPVLALDDGRLLTDSADILRHLAQHHDPAGRWLPADPQARARVDAALRCADALSEGVGRLRLHLSFGLQADPDRCRRIGRDALRALDDTLAEGAWQGRAWLAAEHPTIADIACLPYAALASEAGIDTRPWPAVRAWVQAMQELEGFLPMPGIPARRAAPTALPDRAAG